MDSFAPVYIPTLNRDKLFKECLESLEKCVGAESTDVFVGLDYPPSKKYEDGWKKISIYLQEKEQKHGFKSLTVFRRETNCGIMNSKSNSMLLQKYVSERYETFILTEDDNIFSPNFLIYMNQGLEKYKNDPCCTAVCGYNYYGVKLDDYKSNVYLSREYSAWGVGYWAEKQKKLEDIQSIDYAKKILASWKNIFKIFTHEPRLLNTIMLNVASGKVFLDTMRVSYQYLNNCYSVFPKISKVRNQGFDNSGTTIFKSDDNYNKQDIDCQNNFKFDEIPADVDPKVQRTVESFFKRSPFMNGIILIRVVLYKLFGFDILYKEMKRRNPGLFK